MAKGPRYHVPFRRRREGKTDYRKRKIMILSSLPRLVVRYSLKHITSQIIESYSLGDRTLVSASSQELSKNYGWKAYCGNVPIAYLVGFLIGHKALSQGINQTILDIGLKKASKGLSMSSSNWIPKKLSVPWLAFLNFPSRSTITMLAG